MTGQVYYRYFDSYNGRDVLGNYKMSVLCFEIPVVKVTRRGVVLDEHGTRRFVLNDSIKKYAYPNKRDALYSFIRRKQRQIVLTRHTMRKAEASEALAQGMFDREEYDMRQSVAPPFGF